MQYGMIIMTILAILIVCGLWWLLGTFRQVKGENFHASALFIPGWWPLGFNQRLLYFSKNPIYVDKSKYYIT